MLMLIYHCVEGMDKFLVKTQKNCKMPSSPSNGKRLRQVSIESLKGVVIVEDIVKINRLLRVENQDSTILLQSLQKLEKKIPSRDILKTTKIGHAVKRLRKHSNRNIADLATRIVSDWKSHFEAKLEMPMLDVSCDHKTNASRSTARRHLADALRIGEVASPVAAGDLAQELERETFRQHRNLITGSYQRTVRRIVFALKNREALRNGVIAGQQTVIGVVNDFRQIELPSASTTTSS